MIHQERRHHPVRVAGAPVAGYCLPGNPRL